MNNIPLRYVSLAGPTVRDLIEALQLLDPDWTVPVSELQVRDHQVLFGVPRNLHKSVLGVPPRTTRATYAGYTLAR